jgi:hypothetical protein
MDVVARDLNIHEPDIETLSAWVDVGNIEIECQSKVALVIVGEKLQ